MENAARRFSCALCNKSFKLIKHLQRHTKEKHGNSYRVFCDVCGQTFVRWEHLRRHVVTIHHAPPPQELNPAFIPDMAPFITPAAVPKPRPGPSSAPDPRPGPPCEPAQLPVTASVIPSGGHVCGACGRSFVSSDHMLTHALLDCPGRRAPLVPGPFPEPRPGPSCEPAQPPVTAGIIPSGSSYAEDDAPTVITGDLAPDILDEFETAFRRRLQIYHLSRPVDETVTMQEFLNSTRLQIMENAARRFSCTLCNKSFNLIKHLQRHTKEKHGNNRVVCDVCGETFVRREHLRRHVVTIHQAQPPQQLNQRTIMDEETEIVDLTDDPPEGATTEPDVEYLGATSLQSLPPTSRGKTNSDIVIIEDDEPEVVRSPSPAPQVACHFFFPVEEDVGEDSREAPSFDPLGSPVPEWVDCSTLSSEQVPVEEQPTPETSSQVNTTPFAFTDPLLFPQQIKKEPGFEADVKPSIEELSRVIHAGISPSCPTVNSSDINNTTTNICVKQEPLDDNSIADSVSNGFLLQKSPHVGSSIPKIGPKCSKFKEKEKRNIGLKFSKLEEKVKRNVGPKCPKLEKKVNRKVGPKCSKLEEKVKRNVGPKCSKLKEKENRNVGPNCSKLGKKVNTNVGPKCSKLEEKVNRNVGPNCSKLEEKVDRNVGSKCSKLEEILNRSVGPNCSKLEEKVNRNVGPKCSKLEEKVNRNVGPKCSKLEKKVNRNVGPKCSKLEEKVNRKIGPKCSKFKEQVNKVKNSNVNEKVRPTQYDENTQMYLQNQINTKRKIGPKCAKFRLTEGKTAESPSRGFNLKQEQQGQQYLSQEITNKMITPIKPAVVSIGPKLPLPQCFQRKQSQMQESQQYPEHTEQKSYQEDGTNDNNHIVLKIYTCFKCNHKCTDPLFHEEHLNICSAKRTSKSLHFSFQDYNKQNGFYKCETCSFKFKNQENLTNHLEQHGVKGFICYICGLNYLTLHRLHQHSTTDHKNLEKVFSCNVCEYSSQQINKIKEHMTRHNKDNYLFCSICKCNYEDIEDIERHFSNFHKRSSIQKSEMKKDEQVNTAVREIVNGLRSRKSSVSIEGSKETNPSTVTAINQDLPSDKHCLTESSDLESLASVAKRFETQIIKQDDNYCCNGCNYTFKSLKNLKKHKKLHLQHKPFSCCDNSFVSFSYLDYCKHVSENHKNWKLSCGMCLQSFVKRDSLLLHMVNHVSDDLYCHLCKKNLEDAVEFKKHISKTHINSPVVRYTCKECHFFTPFELFYRKHVTRHTKIKTKSRMQTRLKSSSPEREQVTTTLETKNDCHTTIENGLTSNNQLKPEFSASDFSCTTCSLNCSSSVALKEHIKDAHGYDKPMEVEHNTNLRNEEFRCNKCTFNCSQSTEYINHLKSGHAKQKFICNVCKSEFGFLKYYLKHMTNHAACAVIYVCNECKFSSKKHLVFAKHMRTHSFKRCPLCDYKTQRFYLFINHLETIHTNDEKVDPHLEVSDLNGFNDSTIKKEDNSSETLDSSLKHDIEKVHACCFCSFKTTEIDNLRQHMAVHFNNDSATTNSKADMNSKVSKPSLTLKGLKSKSIPSSAYRSVLKRSEKLEKNGLIPYYCCTKCEYKKNNRRSVSQHIFNTHKIRGGVRNSAIKKVYAIVPQTGQINPQIDTERPKIKRTAKHLEIDNQPSNHPDQNTDHAEIKQNGVKVIEEITPTIKRMKPEQSTSSLLWKCSTCDLQKLSLIAQRQHKKIGHKQFWEKPLLCKLCGFRCGNKGSLYYHHLRRHEGKQIDQTQFNQKKVSTKASASDRDPDDTEKQNVSDTYQEQERKRIVKCIGCDIGNSSKSAQYQHDKFGHDAFWDRPFYCDICEMRFLNRGGMAKHKTYHKQLTCNKCNCFVTPSLKELNVHKEEMCKGKLKLDVKSEEPISAKEDSTNGEEFLNSDDDEHYTCGECNFVTTNVTEFSTHMFVHSGIPDD